MRQELRTWRSEAGSRRWLLSLIAAMKDAALPQPRPLDRSTLEQVRIQLDLPATARVHPPSTLRH